MDTLVDQSLVSCSLPAHILLKMLLHQRFPDYYPHKFLGDLFFASAEKNSALASSYSRFEWRLGVEKEIQYRGLTYFLKEHVMSLIFLVFFTMHLLTKFVNSRICFRIRKQCTCSIQLIFWVLRSKLAISK